LDALIKRSGEFSSKFLDIYGCELEDIDLLLGKQHLISHAFTLIVKKRDVDALKWIVRVSEAEPKFLSKYDHESEVQEFVDRIQETLQSDVDDEAQSLIKTLGTNLGIERTDNGNDAISEVTAEESEDAP
jgi:hypothetical protein